MISLRPFWPVPVALALLGCDFSRPIGSMHPSIQKLPGSGESAPEDLERALLLTARTDLGCERVDIVTTMTRKYVNSTSARYVVEGCEKRALYVETCETYPSCRYLIVSLLDLGTLAKGAPSGSSGLPLLPPPGASATPAATAPSATPAPAPTVPAAPTAPTAPAAPKPATTNPGF